MKPRAPSYLFLNNLYLKKIKVNGFDKIVLCKTGLIVILKILYSGIQSHGLFQIELVADGVQGVKYHLGPGQGVV